MKKNVLSELSLEKLSLKKLDLTPQANLKLQARVTTILLATILVLLAYASYRYPVQWDWTAGKRRSLSEQSSKVIREFPGELVATFFFKKSETDDPKEAATELLNQYHVVNPHLEIRLVDVALDPAMARKAEVTTNGTILLQAGEKTEKVTEVTEESITNALIRLTKGGHKNLYFLTGHGEHAIKSKDDTGLTQAVALLKGEGYQIDTLNLATVETVPENATVLILHGARKTLLPVEVERLQKWLAERGRLLLLSDPDVSSGLEPLLEKWHVSWYPGIVIDPVARLFGGGPTTPLVSQYDATHPITRNLSSASFFPEARGLSVGPAVEGVQVTKLLTGADKGWITTEDLSSGKVAFHPEKDIRGPVTLGVAVEQAKQRVVMVGNVNFANNAYIGFSGNADLFLNMVRWLAEDENFIAIKAKKVTDSGLTLEPGTVVTLFWGLVVLIPLGLIGTGLLIWRQRRRG